MNLLGRAELDEAINHGQLTGTTGASIAHLYQPSNGEASSHALRLSANLENSARSCFQIPQCRLCVFILVV